MIQRLLLSHLGINNQRGQTLVELAVMGLILSLILAGVVDLGRAYFAYIAVTDAAAEGAGYGAAFPDKSEDEIKDRVVAASGGLVSIDRDMIAVDRDAEAITVTVSYSHTLLTAVMRDFGGSDGVLRLRQRAVNRILSE